MSGYKTLEFDSLCVHSGVGEYEHGPVVPPIYQTSTFKFENAAHGGSLFKGEQQGYIYSRMANPTIEAMENSVAQLEGGIKALGCSSGMAAISTTFMALLKAGDHVVCAESVYGPTSTLLATIFTKFDIQVTFVDSSNFSEITKAVRTNTKVLYMETPGNPTLAITDLKKCADLANSINAKLVVDNTFMGPAIQRPFEFGAHVVLHSMTKSLNGHADVVAGIIVLNDMNDYKLFRKVLNQMGGVIDPFNAFLVHRGLKTLDLRMRKMSENAMKIAQFLENHPKIEWVSYPGLKSHPQYEIGQNQHRMNGCMISFEVKGGFEAGETLMNSVKLATLAVSLGGVETLVQHPASMTHASMDKEVRLKAKITDGLVRYSVGIESADDLIDDLEHALNMVKIEELV
ncbi:MAG: aminotransferase class I/II-fold pyridoxal phosphate-dependent enzyme [Melioribacteraceae bacterium]|nr:aminotransferase class I/II-fold pyridoxal phosphate-dependent enzyme [Melioribacteraceae bacterium]MCF8265298.1 aminotransferase class I/II-fold pyridoxal phosphate-dependent enzyme [Melioribacteraceae bacterium]MCF8414331.1 aminotransferase class I/II-fold pyridoxal phosphate-dependent enzyme [Melioribacteraceae bacterium]